MSACSKAGSCDDIVVGPVWLDALEGSVPVPARERRERDWLELILRTPCISVGPYPIAVGFGSSFQLLSRDFPFRRDGGEGGRSKSEKEGEEAGKHAQLINGLPRS